MNTFLNALKAGEETTTDPKDTPEVYVWATEPALVQPTEVPQDQRSMTKLEEKHQKAEDSIAQLEVEKANLTNQVEKLRRTVANMGTMLSETHRECDKLTDEYEHEQEAHSILQKENDEMKETLMHKEELLKVSLPEAEEKHQKAEDSIAQLEVEKANLTNQEYEREREAHSILQKEDDEMMETLMHQEELLKSSMVKAEKKHQKAVETIAQLEVEKSDLKDQVETLRRTVQKIGNMLTETHRECEALTNKYEQKQEANSILEAVNDEMMKTLKELEMKNNEMKQTLMEKEELLMTPWQRLRSNTTRLWSWFPRRRQRTMT
ncbi:leucine-rich repeat flightless-interacting protein 1 [Ictalurus punctatus]|uniref:Leucine-rich repeat flightless-interacting protein 1 n=1 Tax=Ictalurus punctatus TaxID=7998 RepID=A0A2D0QZ25_ICTPU|nr:leucine-rich repeat flightless-interacting protein 1 [Ictalurus punctatus]